MDTDSEDEDIRLIPQSNVLSEILPGKLYLTDRKVANDLLKLQQHDIKGIVSLGTMEDQSTYKVFLTEFEYHWIYIDDEPTESMYYHFEDAIEFIDETEGAIVVHCYAGISRSTTIVAAYLIAKQNMTVDEAMNFIKSKRSFVCPNYGFIKDLNDFYNIFFNV